MEYLSFDVHFVRNITDIKYPFSRWDLVWLFIWKKGALNDLQMLLLFVICRSTVYHKKKKLIRFDLPVLFAQYRCVLLNPRLEQMYDEHT